MKIMLLKDVKGKGREGDVIEVAAGYANNFLIPKGLAMAVDAQAMSEYKGQEAARERREVEEKKEAEKTAEALKDKTIKITAKAGQGKLFGSVTSKDVAEEIKKQLDVEVDRRKIEMEDIKNFGTFPLTVKLIQGVTTSLYVIVTEEEE